MIQYIPSDNIIALGRGRWLIHVQSNLGYPDLVNSQLQLLHFLLFDWLKNSDYEPIVRVLRHMENSAPSLKIFRFVKLWK